MKEIIDSRQMRAFVAVAREGTFTQGAREIFLTQPAASHAIKLLEEDLGCRLFDRVGKRALLTFAGEQLLLRCEHILHTMREVRSDLGALRTWGQTRLRLGATMSACQHILPNILRRFKRQYPDCAIRIESGDNPQLLEHLHANRIDLALMIEPENQSDLSLFPLFTDELFFVVEPSHPWAQSGVASRSEIGSATLILPHAGTQTSRLIDSYFRTERISLNQSIELGSMESIKELVKQGLGVGVMARWPIEREVSAGELVVVPIGQRPLQRRWSFASLRGRTLTLADETYLRLCQDATRPLDVANTIKTEGRGQRRLNHNAAPDSPQRQVIERVA